MKRRQILIGFKGTPDASGETEGSGKLKLHKKNAFEVIGLSRPALADSLTPMKKHGKSKNG
ncbi:MAG: hypothetical protein AAF571_07025 [Verrucomicrobiota bacterium]